jgi:hypothetical protein
MRLTRRAAVLTLALSLFIPAVSGATPIPLSSSELIFNYDFTSATPPPPYDAITVTLELTDTFASDVLEIRLFPELNGVGDVYPIFVNLQNDALRTIELFPYTAEYLDGVFSLTLRWVDFFPVTAVPPTLVSNIAFGVTGTERTTDQPGELVDVPEPATLSLLALGLAAAGARRARGRAES